jgi:hypothetical protein
MPWSCRSHRRGTLLVEGSRVDIPPTAASISDVPEQYILSTQVAFNESSRLNSRAAIWTGIAAVFSAIASVLGVL